MPVTVQQIAAALGALGAYEGENTPAEHAGRSAGLGADVYRLRLLNTLLGAVQKQAQFADETREDSEELFSAWGEQLKAAVDPEDAAKQMGFLGWQVRRAGVPLYSVAQDPEAGPGVVAASRAGEALHTLLGVIVAVDEALPKGDVDTVVRQYGVLHIAREFLVDALDNLDTLLGMVEAGQP